MRWILVGMACMVGCEGPTADEIAKSVVDEQERRAADQKRQETAKGISQIQHEYEQGIRDREQELLSRWLSNGGTREQWDASRKRWVESGRDLRDWLRWAAIYPDSLTAPTADAQAQMVRERYPEFNQQ